ncbi:probable G-protein coupled receptor No9 [Watersipora subatra]|uniref:probable G-protein coupled receptor No9 n=1 Tax=Watersipora subatra TaxID=2589382 RepID=UPI00355BD2DD
MSEPMLETTVVDHPASYKEALLIKSRKKMESVRWENISENACWDKYGRVNMCQWDFILKAIILLFIVISIVVGNSLVIISVALYKRLRKSVSNSFIASLAVVDLLLGLVILPLSVSKELLGYWSPPPTLCKIWLVADIWICTASILHLCAISVDRYIAIAFPLKYPSLMTHRRCRLTCLGMWALSFVICFPALINLDERNRDTNCDVINDSTGYTIYSALGSFFIPSFVMTGFYIKIFLMARSFMKQSHRGVIVKESTEKTMRVHRGVSTSSQIEKANKAFYEMNDLLTSPEVRSSGDQGRTFRTSHSIDIVENNSDSPTHSTLRRSSHKSDRSETYLLHSLKRNKAKATVRTALNKEARAAKTVAIIVGGFILCWSPFFICYLLEGIELVKINQIVFDVFFWIGYVNSLLNPCIYALFSIDYRHAFKKILRCQLRRDLNSKGMLGYLGSLYISSSSSRQNSFSAKPLHLIHAPA